MADIGIYYLIRHKATGQYMPQMKRGRGYTHWNPGNPNAHEVFSKMGIPRLIDTRRRAAKCIIAWSASPNAKQGYSVSFEGTEDYSLDTKDDGRKKEDLEIVEVELVIRSV